MAAHDPDGIEKRMRDEGRSRPPSTLRRQATPEQKQAQQPAPAPVDDGMLSGKQRRCQRRTQRRFNDRAPSQLLGRGNDFDRDELVSKTVRRWR